MRVEFGGAAVEFIRADITTLEVEAIVNPANTELLMGGGVAGAIKNKGGKQIENEARTFAPIELGDSIITSAGKLPAKYVIHTATMRLDFKTDYDIVRNATRSVLKLCMVKGIKEVAFPILGAGVGGLNIVLASKIMVQEFFKAIRQKQAPERILLVFYTQRDFEKGLVSFSYLDHLISKTMQGPFVTVDAVVFDNLKEPSKVVLIKRRNPPFGWALPGGFLDYGETVEQAVVRELKEETALDYKDFKQLHVFSDPNRDERFHTVTVAFVGKAEGVPIASSDAAEAMWFELDKLPEKIAFDHLDIINCAIGILRGDGN